MSTEKTQRETDTEKLPFISNTSQDINFSLPQIPFAAVRLPFQALIAFNWEYFKNNYSKKGCPIYRPEQTHRIPGG
jgi:hypothetical protein